MSVHQISGHWYYRFTINGVRHRKAIKEARTRRQAEKAEQVIRNEVFERRYGESGQRNFADFVEKVYTPNARQRKKGFHVERSVLRALNARFGNHKLAEITPDKVEQFQRDRAGELTTRKRLRSRATVNRDVAVLSAIFKLALRLGDVKENPVSKIQYFNNLPKRDRVLTEDEEIALIKALCSTPDLRRIFELLLYSGLRRSEAFRLQWRDIDFANGFILLRSETTKTGRGRKIWMVSIVRTIFDDLVLEAGNESPSGIIFDGSENRAGTFSARFKAICEELNIQNVTSHTLRHTYSTRCDRLGVGPFAQRETLGHAKLSQTADYTHQSNDTIRRNFDGFEDFLRIRKSKMTVHEEETPKDKLKKTLEK